MAVTVAELQVSFNAETKRFNAQVASIDKRLGTFEAKAKKSAKGVSGAFKSLKGVITKIGPAIAGVAAALGVNAFVNAAKGAVKFGDSLEQTSKKIGFGVEALQELRFAAEQNGLQQQTLDLALQRFSRRVGEATIGTGEAKKALEEMGIVLKDNEGNFRGNEAVLADVADALKNTSSSSDRLRLAFKLFDSEGAGFVNVLALGSEGMEVFREQARELGIVIDRDVIKNSAEMSKQLKIAEKIMSAELNEAMIQLAPIAIDLVELFGDFAEVLGDIVAGFQDLENLSLDKMKDRQTELLVELTESREQLQAFEKTYRALIDTGDFGTVGELERLQRAVKALESELATVDEAVDRRIKRRKREDEAPTGGGGGGTGPETPEQAAARKKLEGEQKANLNTIRDLTIALRQERLAATEPLLADIDAIEVEIAKISTLRVADAEANAEKTEALVGLAEKRTELQDKLKEETEAQITLETELEDAVAAVAVADFARAEAILTALAARKAEAVGVEETAAAVRAAIASIKKINTGDAKDDDTADDSIFNLGDSVSGAVERGALSGLNAAFTGEGVDLAETFSTIFADIFNDSMSSLLEDLTESLSDIINDFAGSLGDAAGSAGGGEGGGAGGFNVGAALGAAFAIGGSILARELADDQVKVKRASVTSAVNSSQQIRGVVAGPTGIAIAKVQDTIADAWLPAEMLLAEIRDNTGQLVQQGVASGGAGGSAALSGLDTNASGTLG